MCCSTNLTCTTDGGECRHICSPIPCRWCVRSSYLTWRRPSLIQSKSIAETVDSFRKMMDINAIGTLLCFRVAAAAMIKGNTAKGGRLIAAASNAGKRGVETRLTRDLALMVYQVSHFMEHTARVSSPSGRWSILPVSVPWYLYVELVNAHRHVARISYRVRNSWNHRQCLRPRNDRHASQSVLYSVVQMS
jgi:hypothetical protein